MQSLSNSHHNFSIKDETVESWDSKHREFSRKSISHTVLLSFTMLLCSAVLSDLEEELCHEEKHMNICAHNHGTFFCNPLVNITVMSKKKSQASHEVHMSRWFPTNLRQWSKSAYFRWKLLTRNHLCYHMDRSQGSSNDVHIPTSWALCGLYHFGFLTKVILNGLQFAPFFKWMNSNCHFVGR